MASCLDKDPTQRPSAAEVALALKELVAGRPRGEAQKEGPFRGLLPFLEMHSHQYFGRQEEIGLFLERLRVEPVQLVVGPSGAGKSSFVRAGILPRLREQDSTVVITLRPGSAPLSALAAQLLKTHDTVSSPSGSLDRPHDAEAIRTLEHNLTKAPRALGLELRRRAEELGRPIVLFVDQLEELFTLGSDEETRDRYLAALMTAADDSEDPVRVIMTIRDDFLARLAVSRDARLGLGHLTVLQTPRPKELCDILVRSVRSVEFDFEDPKLVEDMVQEVQDTPGALPLLQFAGQQLWEHRDQERKLLLRSHYQRMGGVAGALGRHGDRLLERLGDAELNVARCLLLRLVTPARTRAVATRHEVLDGLPTSLATDLLDRLVAARLVTSRKTRNAEGAVIAVVELVHESLIGHWPTLTRWLDATRDDLTSLVDADQAAEMWERRGRRDADLWRDEPLLDALRALARVRDEAPPRVERFLTASAARQRRRQRLRRLGAVASIGALAMISAVFAWQKRDADEAREVAEVKQAEAEQSQARALREAARADFSAGRILEASAQLRLSLETQDSTSGRALWWQMQRQPLQWRLPLSDAVFYDAVFANDDRTVYSVCQNRVLYAVDGTTGAATELRGHLDQPIRVAAHKGNLVSGSWSGELIWWDAERARVLSRSEESIPRPKLLSFTPDGRHLVSGGRGGEVIVWSTETHEPLRRFDHGTTIASGDVLPDGTGLVVGSELGLTVYDLASGARLDSIEQPAAVDIAVHPDGTELATLDIDGSLRFWSWPSKKLRLRVDTMRADQAWSVAYHPGGARVAVSSRRGETRILDVSTGSVVDTFAGSSGGRQVTFDSQGDRLVTSGMGAISLWDATASSAAPPNQGHGDGVLAVVISDTLGQVLSADYAGVIKIWDIATGEDVGTLAEHADSVHSMSVDRAGTRLASASNDKTIRLWDLESRQQKVVIRSDASLEAVGFADDAGLVFGGDENGLVRGWRIEDGAPLVELGPIVGGIVALDISEDQARLVASSRRGHVADWDLTKNTLMRGLEVEDTSVRAVAFDPQGELLLGGVDGRLLRSKGETVDLLTTLSDADGAAGRLYAIEPTSDGGFFTADSLGRIRRMKPGGQSSIFATFSDEANAVALSRDERTVAASSDDSTVRLFDAASGKPLWFGTALLPAPARAFSHLGRKPLGNEALPAASMAEQTFERAPGLVRASADGETLCVDDGSALSLWQRDGTQPIATAARSELRSLAAADRRCLVATANELGLLTAEGFVSLEAKATVVASNGSDRFVVATEDEVFETDVEGQIQRTWPTGPGVTAVAPIGDAVAAGFWDGSVRLLGGAEPSPRFEGTAASAAHTMLEGPMGTMAVGFADGSVGLWNRADGRRLLFERLHGPISHFLLEDQTLYVLSQLGQSHSWDLSIFYRTHCEVLKAIWQRVPIVLIRSRIALQPPPEDHPCHD